MKSLSVAILSLLFSATVCFAQNSNKVDKEPFPVNINQLSKYLELTPSQINEVASISEYFVEKQNESLTGSKSRQDKKMQQAVFSNLKLMKKALSENQYRKYVTLLNVTNNNNNILATNSVSDVYLAEKICK